MITTLRPGTFTEGQPVRHATTGHQGVVEATAAGSYLVRWADATLPARWFDGLVLTAV